MKMVYFAMERSAYYANNPLSLVVTWDAFIESLLKKPSLFHPLRNRIAKVSSDYFLTFSASQVC